MVRRAEIKGRVFLLLLALAVIGVLAGCASDGAKYKTKLVVWGLQSSEEAAGQRAMVAEFEKRHPGVKVSVLSMGAGGMNPQKLMTAIVGKQPPDVINQDRFTIGDWASRDTFMPLDSLIKRDRDKPMGIRPEDYYKPCWAEATYKGRVFAIPNSTDVRILYYNKDCFKAAGLDPNKPPQTWSQLLDYAKRLTTYDRDGNLKQVGFIPNWGNSWLYLYSWQNGGEFMDPSGHKCTMDNPRSVEALKYMVSVYDALKGAERVDKCMAGFQPNELDPFYTGRVAMRIECDSNMTAIARYGPDLNFGVAPAPVPDERFKETYSNFVIDKDGRPVHVSPADYGRYPKPKPGRFNGQPRYLTWSGGFSWAIPRGAKHVDLGWEFIKWMCTPEAQDIGARAQITYNKSKGRPYVPTMHANIRVNELIYPKYSPKSTKFRTALNFALQIMPYSKFRPVTFVGQRLWDEHVRAWDQAIHHGKTGKTPLMAMTAGTRIVQKELDETFGRSRFPRINLWVLWSAIAFVLLAFAAVIFLRARKERTVGKLMRSEAWAGYIFASPWIIGFLVFTIGPIVASIVFSFCDYDVLHDARWVGMTNYHQILTNDWPLMSKALYNALYLAIIGIPLGLATGLAIAMLLNARVTGMTWYRTIYYLPSIVPMVASAVLWIWVLNPDFGIINVAWKATLGAWFHVPSPGWLSSPEWSKPSLIFMGLWGAGGGMILWLAGLQGIPQSLYEAAEIDGANQWQKFRAVTIPMLTPYIFFNLIMGTIGALQMFEGPYIMTGGGPVDSTMVPMLYLFNNAFTYFKMGYASAIAWILFVIILTLALIQLKLAPRWVHYEAEKGK